MNEIKNLPGYLTLSEAEESYGVKANTLKKRCQKKKLTGAKKVGKTWFIPNIPGIDPERTIPENYPDLDFDSAYIHNLALYNTESNTKVSLYNIHKQEVFVWEYGYYFFSLIFHHTRIDRTYLPFAVFVSEAHTALRSSFLLNLVGYHSDAISLLRRAQECTTKALAMRIEPKNIWKIGFSKSREQYENKIGVNFKSLWNLASTFTHGNLMKLFEVGKDINNPSNDITVGYGPQTDNKLYSVAMNGAIFWLYVLTKSLSYLFPGQIEAQWLTKKDSAAKFLRDYLISRKSMVLEVKMIDSAIEKLEVKT
jgi:hypothetical protein